MSGYQQQPGHGRADYDDGYAHPGAGGHAAPGVNDPYYQDDQQYYDNAAPPHPQNGAPYDAHGAQQGDGYYDESYVERLQ